MSAWLRRAWESAWESRAPRERKLITALLVTFTAALYLWLVTTADRERNQLQVNIPILRKQAYELEQQASEYERLNIGLSPSMPGSLRELLQTGVDEAAGLSRSLTGIDAVDENQVTVTYGSVVFPDWLEWVTRMQSNNLRLSSTKVEALPEPGRVNVTATFIRPRVE